MSYDGIGILSIRLFFLGTFKSKFLQEPMGIPMHSNGKRRKGQFGLSSNSRIKGRKNRKNIYLCGASHPECFQDRRISELKIDPKNRCV